MLLGFSCKGGFHGTLRTTLDPPLLTLPLQFITGHTTPLTEGREGGREEREGGKEGGEGGREGGEGGRGRGRVREGEGGREREREGESVIVYRFCRIKTCQASIFLFKKKNDKISNE